jgi:hypothetical protein
LTEIDGMRSCRQPKASFQTPNFEIAIMSEATIKRADSVLDLSQLSGIGLAAAHRPKTEYWPSIEAWEIDEIGHAEREEVADLIADAILWHRTSETI